MNYITHWCKLCGGCTHPATGCVYAADWIVCRNCTLAGWLWMRSVLFSKGGRKGVYFYEHVKRSGNGNS